MKKSLLSVLCVGFLLTSYNIDTHAYEHGKSSEIEIDLRSVEEGDVFTVYANKETDTLVEIEIEKVEKTKPFDIGDSGWSGGTIPDYNVSMVARVSHNSHKFQYYVHTNNQNIYAVDRLTYYTAHNWSVTKSWLNFTSKKATLEFTAFRNTAGGTGITYNGLGMNLTGNSTASFRGYLIFEISSSGKARTSWSI
ncbi:MAG: hypothetical protein ACRCZJ_08685 [Erysipelotrichaceae bacterium]